LADHYAPRCGAATDEDEKGGQEPRQLGSEEESFTQRHGGTESRGTPFRLIDLGELGR